MKTFTIHLHGPYRAYHTGPVEVQAKTPAEALELATIQIAGFKPDLNGPKRVRVAGYRTIEALHTPANQDTDLHVMPAITFAEDKSWTQIVVGAVLIVVGAYTENPYLISMGLSLVVGGVMNLLVPVPKLSKEEEERSKYLGSPPNTIGLGTRVPFGYGLDLVQGHILSSNISAAEIL